MGDGPELCRWAQNVISRVPIREKGRQECESERGWKMLEDGGRGHVPRSARSLQKLSKARKQFLPERPQEEQPCRQ